MRRYSEGTTKMIVNIERLWHADKICYVEFSSKFGFGIAEWDGDTPFIEHSYDIEFDFDNIFKWHKNIFESQASNCHSISLINNHKTSFTAIVEDKINDNLICISIGGNIAFLEVDWLPKNCPEQVTFITDDIKIYPVKL